MWHMAVFLTDATFCATGSNQISKQLFAPSNTWGVPRTTMNEYYENMNNYLFAYIKHKEFSKLILPSSLTSAQTASSVAHLSVDAAAFGSAELWAWLDFAHP